MYGHLPHMTDGTDGTTLTVGQLIRRAREAAGLGQNEMAKKVGVEGATAYRWEADRITPGIERLTTIAGVLGVPVADLVPDGYEPSATDEDSEDVPVVSDSPDELMHLAELAIAAARGGVEAKLELYQAVKELARRLRAAERTEKAR